MPPVEAVGPCSHPNPAAKPAQLGCRVGSSRCLLLLLGFSAHLALAAADIPQTKPCIAVICIK